MKKKKVVVAIGIFAAAIGILCIAYTGCRKEPESGQEEAVQETVEVKTREELPKETKKEALEEQKEEPENRASDVKEPEESAPAELATKEQRKMVEEPAEKTDKIEESAPAPVKEPEPTPAKEETQKPESVPEMPPAAEAPAPEPGFDAEHEAILFARINESRGGDLLEGTWVKNKAREKAKAQDGSGSGVLFGYNTTGDVAHMAERLITSYGSTIDMGWKSFGCGVYQSGGTYYYCVVFDTMTD